MFFESIDEIQKVAVKNGTSVFVVPDDCPFEIKNALVVKPEDKATITIEQVREMIRRLMIRQTSEQFVIVRPADKMGPDAANALLKNLEEPGEKVHFVLITSEPSRLLPTILSRSEIYFLKSDGKVDGDILADAKMKDLAKKLIVAKPGELPALAEEICKKKDGVREYALNVLGVTIEMLYKSYFKTNKMVFIKKLPAFLMAYENINRNGHIKLHLVADLI